MFIFTATLQNMDVKLVFVKLMFCSNIQLYNYSLCLKFTISPKYVVLPLQEYVIKGIKINTMTIDMTYFFPVISIMLRNLHILVFNTCIYYNGNLYIHSNMNVFFKNRILNIWFAQQIEQVFRWF